MFKFLRVEFEKLNYSKAPLLGFLLLILISVAVAAVEFSNMPIDVAETFYVDFMLFNSTFLVMKIIVPVLILLLAASIWGGEYADGMIKSFLLCKVSKNEMFVGKLLLLIFSSVMAVLATFVIFTVISLLKGGTAGISLQTILEMAKVYALTTVGLLPILLLTVLASILLGDFQKGFSVGIVSLILSLSMDSILENAYLTPTYFLSHGSVIYTSKVSTESVIALGFYLVLLTISGIMAFNNKDIWQ